MTKSEAAPNASRPNLPPVPTARSSGVYGVANLDGSPVARRDAVALGILLPPAMQSFCCEGHDPYAPAAIHRYEDAGAVTLLVGEVFEPEDLAGRLGLARSSPIALLARAALARFGSNTPAELLGEWSMVHRDKVGRVTLMIGPAVRDRLQFAVSASRLAFAPDLFRLARIDWVGTELDEAGLLFSIGRGALRQACGDRTMLTRVRRLAAGASVLIHPDGRCDQMQADVLIEPRAWRGSFEDAVRETEVLLRHIMRERLAGTTLAAPLLSGGLDSSLLAWLAAEERRSGQWPMYLTSTAPPGSGLADESAYAAIVARHLGRDINPTYPAPHANSYRPTDEILSGTSGPLLSNRHCLTDAFQIAARAAGATLLVNGTYGEMSVTERLPAIGLGHRLRAFAAQIRSVVRQTESEAEVLNSFHVRLAPHQLASLPEPVQAALATKHTAPEQASRLAPSTAGLHGYTPGIEKGLNLPNEFYPGAIRMDYPYRDIRLLRLFARFPTRVLLEGGSDRPVVRQILKGRLPDSIRLRRRGMPASPDHLTRLQLQAATARDRIPEFRKHQIDEWLDLNWLDQTLANVSARGPASVDEANEVQLTAITAEFLLWWRARF